MKSPTRSAMINCDPHTAGHLSPIVGRLARAIRLDIALDQFGTAEVIMLHRPRDQALSEEEDAQLGQRRP